MIRKDLNFRDQILQAVAIPDKKLKISSSLFSVFVLLCLEYFQPQYCTISSNIKFFFDIYKVT